MIAIVAQSTSLIPSRIRAEFEDAVRLESARLYAIALTITRNSTDAEDAVQETMVKAWRSWGSLRDESKRRAWLTKICVNGCISHRRSRLRRIFTSLDDLGQEPADARALQAFDPVDPDLERAMQRLTTQQRAVVTLHYHLGYTLDECASLMGSRPGTVRSHLNRALTSLRGQLSNA